jgi:hypothetical protein
MQAAAWYPALESADEVDDGLVPGHGEVTAGAKARRSDGRIGKGHQRMERGDALMWRKHLEAECSRAMGHDGAGHRPDRRSDAGDRLIGNREQQHVDASGS